MTIPLAITVGIWLGLLLALGIYRYSDYRFEKRCRDNRRETK
jgi:hypothetical protein